MTSYQKNIIEKLLLGYTVYNARTSGYRLRSPEHHVCLRFSVATFNSIRKYLRSGKGFYVIDKRIVRSLSGKTWIKQEYKKIASTAGTVEA